MESIVDLDIFSIIRIIAYGVSGLKRIVN